MCKCTDDKAICSGKNLTYIPRFPSGVQSVTFLNGNIGTLSIEKTKNLTFNEIKELNFTNNAIARLEPDTFSNLTNLSSLTISAEFSLFATDVKNALYNLKTASLKSLTLTCNNWSVLPDNMFRSIYTYNIQEIDISRNNLQVLNFSWFTNITSLKTLRVSFNRISAFIPGSIFRLQKLYLNNNAISKIPDNMFRSIHTNKIHNIDISRNNLQVLNFSWFTNITSLKTLRVSFNRISAFIPGIIFSLNKLYLDNNEISKVPKFCINHGYNSSLPNLNFLSLSGNYIGNVGQLRCFPKLRQLKIGYNLIGSIHKNSFTGLKVLSQLSLEGIRKQLKKIEDGAFDIPSLLELSLRNCNFHFERMSASAQSSLLSSCNNLVSLDLGGNYMTSIIVPRIISPLKQLRYLNLENCRLGFLPAKVFPDLPFLNTLIVRRNRVYGWDKDVFDSLNSLQYLDLNNNVIKIVNESSFPTALLSNLKKINLGYNYFACTCEQIWFVNWLQKTNITLIGYPSQYICSIPEKYNGKLLKDYKPSVLSCNPVFTIVISMSAFVFLIISITIVFFKCNTNIKNLIYLLKVKQFRRQGYLPILNSDDYEYHAFVVYCEENRMWVHNDFVKKLENDEGFKFCIHHRDFEVGKPISVNIDQYLKKSWKVVVIISNAFAKSEWCQWEIDIIQERRRRQGRNALLLVMLENITSKNMTSPLRTLLDSTTHLRFKKGIGENLFWTAVVEDLRKDIGLPPVSEL
ncbi:toll-like receptor 13 [Mytilus galloprovincialis]|uniref:Toll-like receptor 13 n=1 Tax=Mytilus galloprovincialis TaxID=29158 RepID=A0A8B6E608_MYTGA|nr:toll-like receptor 13 [Mytilus galloprovincialis]